MIENLWTWSEWEHGSAEVRHSRVLVAGVGGNGSFAAEALVRLGFEDLVLADPDRVEPRNLGRQNYEKVDVGFPKVHALSRRLLAIAPAVKIESREEGVSLTNCESLIQGVDIVVDAVDDYRIKVALSRGVTRHCRPKVHTSGAGYKGSITVFMPEGIDYETMFGLPSSDRDLTLVTDAEFAAHRRRIAGIVGNEMYGDDEIGKIGGGDRWPTIVTPCACAGVLAAFEAYKVAVGDLANVLIAPRILEFDARRHIYVVRELMDGC